MKGLKSRLRMLLPHGAVILALMFLTFLVLDVYNPLMQFVDNGVSRVLLAGLCLISLVNAFFLICQRHKR